MSNFLQNQASKLFEPKTDTEYDIELFLASRGIGRDRPVNCCFTPGQGTTIAIDPIINDSVVLYSTWVEHHSTGRRRRIASILNKNVPVIIILATKGGHATAIIVTGNNEDIPGGQGRQAEIFGFGLLTDGINCKILSPDPTSISVDKIKQCSIRAILPIHDDITNKLIEFINEHKDEGEIKNIRVIPLDFPYRKIAYSNPGERFAPLASNTYLNCINFLTHIMPVLKANIGALQICHTDVLRATDQSLPCNSKLIDFITGTNENEAVIAEFSNAPDNYDSEPSCLVSGGKGPLQKNMSKKNKRTGEKLKKK